MDWCCTCLCSGEDVDHILIHFEAPSQLWSFAFKSFEVSWILPKRMFDPLAGWRNCLGKHSSDIWILVPQCVVWIIWRECNNHISEDLESSKDQLIHCLQALCFIGLSISHLGTRF